MVTASQLKDHIGKNIEIYGNLVNSKKTGTSNGKYMYFGTFYDPEGVIFDVVLFPSIAEKYPIRSKGIYLCYGEVVSNLGYISISIKKLSRQVTQTDPRLVGTNFKFAV